MRHTDRELRRIERGRGLTPGMGFSGPQGLEVLVWCGEDLRDRPFRQQTLRGF